MYEQGVISKETQGTHLLRAAGLPESDLCITEVQPQQSVQSPVLGRRAREDSDRDSTLS